MLIVAQLVVTACSESIGSVEPPKLANPPRGLTLLCNKPVELPLHPLSQLEVEVLWIDDRNNLIGCGLRLQSLIDFYKSRDKRITTQ